MNTTAEQIDGYAAQVWGGWVWIVDGVEQRWSKRTTEAECTATVLEVVSRMGETSAFSRD